jgi:hypothetical protein
MKVADIALVKDVDDRVVKNPKNLDRSIKSLVKIKKAIAKLHPDFQMASPYLLVMVNSKTIAVPFSKSDRIC